MTPAPQRAQRVRGIPGVGLRTPDGREWARDGSTYVVVSGMRHLACAVRYCGRPSKWGNPFSVPKRPSIHPDGQPYWPVWVCVIAGKPIFENVARTRLDALRSSIDYFAEDLDSADDAYFTGLLGYDYLSCFCPLDQPCHVDAIIAEGVARGIWTQGETT